MEQALSIPKIHDTAQARRDRIGAEIWNDLATFTIVRHPYDRVRSLYKYRVKTAQTGLGDRTLGMEDWVRATFRDRDPAYYNRPLMFAPARDWISDTDGTLMVDLIAKLETIAADWPRIQALIGTEATLPRANATAREAAPAAAAFGAETRAILANHFAADFDTFDYTA